MTSIYDEGYNYRHYEDAAKTLEAAYARLTVRERIRANAGTLEGSLIAAILGFLASYFHDDLLEQFSGFASRFSFVSSAYAQGTTGSHIPLPIVYLIYIALLAILLVSGYEAIIKRNQTLAVSFAWKTLLGFFIGQLTHF